MQCAPWRSTRRVVRRPRLLAVLFAALTAHAGSLWPPCVPGAHVVIKQYSVPMSELDERERRGAANEISVLKSLVHPNVIRYLHDFQHGDVLHIVMEYADQGTLHEVRCLS